MALFGLFNVVGSFYAGKLGGRHSKKLLLSGVYGLRAFGMLLLLAFPLSPWVLYVFAAWMGLFWLGTVPLTQGLIGQIYGLRYAATLSGIAFLGHQVGSFIGVWLGGVPPTRGLMGQLFVCVVAAALWGIAVLGTKVGSCIGVWLGGYV